MKIKTKYEVSNQAEFLPMVRQKVMPILISLVQAQVDSYLDDLAKHMGTISGAVDFTDNSVHWEALDEETLETSPKFWYESGKTKRAITVNVKMTNNGIHAFVGITEGSSEYQTALWNELGFTPNNGDKLVRRPLFFPLAATHKAILEERIHKSLRAQKVTIRI